VKVALPVVRGLHGSRAEGTTRRFKVGDFKTEFNGLGVLRTDIRTVPGRRRGDRIGERMSASDPSGPQPPTPVCILAVRSPWEGRLAALLVSRDVLTKAQMSACGG